MDQGWNTIIILPSEYSILLTKLITQVVLQLFQLVSVLRMEDSTIYTRQVYGGVLPNSSMMYSEPGSIKQPSVIQTFEGITTVKR